MSSSLFDIVKGIRKQHPLGGRPFDIQGRVVCSACVARVGVGDWGGILY